MVGFWLLVGAGAGTTSFLAAGAPAGLAGWWEHARDPVSAGICWIPLTLGIFTLGARLPLRGKNVVRRLAIYLPLSLLISFVLNAMFGAVHAATGTLPWGAVAGRALRFGLQWIHVNTGAFWVLVAIGHRLAHDAAAMPVAPERLRVNDGARSVYLPVDQIDWIEGAGDYARIHAGEREVLSDQRLKDLEATLGARRFARIHRSTIVNLDRIRTMRHLSHGDYEAELTTGVRLRVSRARRNALRASMEQFPGPQTSKAE